MSSKARLCAGCGRWAETGQWVEDEEGRWWVCTREPECPEGAKVLTPQPPPPTVDY